jgi:hypothetical protein
VEECSQQAYYLVTAPWLLRSLALVLGLTMIWTATAVVALMRAHWIMGEQLALRREVTRMGHLHRDFQALRQDLEELLDQGRQWDRRAAALYPSLADLLDDKIATLDLSLATEIHNQKETQMDTQAINNKRTSPEVGT